MDATTGCAGALSSGLTLLLMLQGHTVCRRMTRGIFLWKMKIIMLLIQRHTQLQTTLALLFSVCCPLLYTAPLPHPHDTMPVAC